MKRILSVVLLLLAVVGGLLLCDRVTRRDDAERKFGPFFAEKQGATVFYQKGDTHTRRKTWLTAQAKREAGKRGDPCVDGYTFCVFPAFAFAGLPCLLRKSRRKQIFENLPATALFPSDL